MIKPILINSYPRSGSVFFAELTNSIGVTPHQFSTVLHVPELIGIDEAITVTIVRDPRECITSDIFKGLLVNDFPEDVDNLNRIIKLECEYYLKFLEMCKLKNPYLINFKNLTSNPKNEVVKFLEKHNINKHFVLNIDNILKGIEQKKFPDDKHDLYTGHFPRGANQDPEYIKIFNHINNSVLLDEAYKVYEEIIKDI